MSLKRKKPRTVDDIAKTRTARPDVREVTTEDGSKTLIAVAPSYTVSDVFEWDALKIRVAELVAEGVPIYTIVGLPGMPTSRTTIYQWMKHPDYKKYVDSLIRETGLANQTARTAAMQNVLNTLYDKLAGELKNVNLTEKNAASLIEKFFNGLRQMQEDAKGYVQEVNITTNQTINSKSQSVNLKMDFDKILQQAPAEKRALLQQEFSARADAFIRGMTGNETSTEE